ncbi:flagellar hook protein FlgE [Acidaminobacter sp. JC074]|uniref:flagellar hook protein FlgE n=1 Tax=Acidaminobacter sp. JC074 TaxID=2530199 RepID=UPI001F0D84F8|nr:flagellar hook protein FlgE [Acidaminobacter sp. JC074]MCH4888726.1 flagellar hook protein FlgE [Acidaminobacter sp. JC074]
MMRSMYSGVSGLQVHQVKMDIIGNNIANVNTVGFKGSKVTFQEVFSQTIKGAGAPQEGRGGTNPQQVGLGVGLSAINVQHTKGSTQITSNPTDIMIDGNGFFVVSSDDEGTNKFYTRAGNFSLDKLGYLVNPSGLKVLDSDFKPIRINKSDTIEATATSEIELTSNINFNYDSDDVQDDYSIYTTTTDVYDSVGNKTTLSIQFGQKFSTAPGTAAADTRTYRQVKINAPGASGGGYGGLSEPGNDTAYDATTNPGGLQDNMKYAEFDKDGNFVRLIELDVADINVTTGIVTPPAAPTTGVANLIIQQAGVEEINIAIDNDTFKNVTHYSQTTDMKATPVNGNSAGALDSFAISSAGEIFGTYTNGERATLSTVGLADFDNAPGLMKIGGNLFTDTPNSGSPKFGVPGTGSFGQLAPGALEMSNVDLSQEFTDMITTQRGFQANSRVITTTDEMLQELVNLKR